MLFSSCIEAPKRSCFDGKCLSSAAAVRFSPAAISASVVASYPRSRKTPRAACTICSLVTLGFLPTVCKRRFTYLESQWPFTNQVESARQTKRAALRRP